MRTVNKVILIGNITKDPFVRTTANGKKVALFTVATNRSFKDGSGALNSEAEYTNCSTWGSLADRAEQFLVKGKLVYVEGHLKTRTIDKDNGEKMFKTEVVVTNLIFLNKRGEFEDADDSIEDAESYIEEDRF